MDGSSADDRSRGAAGSPGGAAEPARLLALLPARYRPEGSPVFRAERGVRLVATDTHSGTRVFVRLSGDLPAVRREAAALRRIRHPGVVRLLDHGEAAGGGFLVQEWIGGGTLQASLAAHGGRLPAAVVRTLLAALADALAAVHAARFVHRDLKPGNVLLREDGSPVIVDFETALPFGGGSAGGAALLTPGYAAPERYAAGAPEGPWTDVYSLGAIAWRALVGHEPPPVAERGEGAGLPWPDDLRGRIPDELAAMLQALLSVDPRRRPPSAGEVAQALRPAGSAGPGPQPAPARIEDDGPPTVRVERRPDAAIPPVRPPDPTREPERRRRPRWLGGAGLVALAVGLLLLLGAALVLGWPLYERHLKREWVVDAAGGGDVASISEALARARDGAVVRVRPGTYRESLRVSRPVTLAAADIGTPPVVSPESGPCLAASAAAVRVEGLVLQAPPASAGGAGEACVVVEGGSLRLEGNSIRGEGGPALLVQGGAEPEVIRNAIRSTGPGIVVTGGARGTFTENTVSETAGPAIVVRGGAAPTIAESGIDGSGAVLFTEGGRGIFRGNVLRGGRGNGIEITGGADPQVIGNRVEGAAQSAVYVYEGGRGRIEDNAASGARLSGIVLGAGGAPALLGNTVTDSGEHGILALGGTAGRIDGNTVRNSKRHGIVIAQDSAVELGRNTLEGNEAPQQVDLRKR